MKTKLPNPQSYDLSTVQERNLQDHLTSLQDEFDLLDLDALAEGMEYVASQFRMRAARERAAAAKSR